MKKVILFLTLPLMVASCIDASRSQETESTVDLTSGWEESQKPATSSYDQTMEGLRYHEEHGPSQGYSQTGQSSSGQNDMFMDMLASPNASFDDFVIVGYNQSNTTIRDASVYKNNPWVREKLSDQYGNFNEGAFSKAYNLAREWYKNLANVDRDKVLKSKVSHHRDDIFAPKEQRRSGPDLIW